MDLFGENDTRGRSKPDKKSAPLADRMRPASIEEFVGQEHLLGEGKLLRRILSQGQLPSLILWGPPGSGKTTLARILAASANAEFIEYSAVLSGVKEIRETAKIAEDNLRRGKKTVLFIDEIHRFNKAQQDAFLHSVEEGVLTLIGATTENPSFEVNSPLLSRCKVLVLNAHTDGDIKNLLDRAINDKTRGLGLVSASIDDKVIDFIAESSHGDARTALNSIDAAYMITAPDERGVRHITMDIAAEAMQKKALLYDATGEEHYNVISAFIKSMRGSDADAALYWLSRMVDAGEDPLFIARRMVIFASEDIGNADPRAIMVANAVKDSVDFVGMPEGFITLAQGVTYLATAPKSNASYAAYLEALSDVRKYGALPVPLHIRNAPTKLMKELGYHKGYKYPHDYKDAAVEQDYLPEKLSGRTYYKPKDVGYEKQISEKMKKK